MWWRSTTRAFLSRSLTRKPSPHQLNQVSSKTLFTIPPCASRWALRPVYPQCPVLKFFSSAHEVASGEEEYKNVTFGFSESNDPLFSGAGEAGIDGENADFLSRKSDDLPTEGQSWNFKECEASPEIEDERRGSSELDGEVGGESLNSLWEENIQDDNASGIFVAENTDSTAADSAISEVDMKQVEMVQSLLRSNSEESLETSLNQIEFSLSEDFVTMVLQTPYISGQNLISFYRWALRNEESVQSSRMLELLVNAISGSAELSKMDAYKLWDLVKEIGNKKVLLNTSILNQLISIFGRLEKPKAGLEVFNKFSDYGCNPDGNTYYLTVEALSKKSMFDTAWPVCEKMLSSGNLPDGEKIGKIVTFLCKGKKVKEAHSVYLMAHEKEIFPPKSTLDSLISSLSRNDETLPIALKLLENYPKDTLRYANASFGSVVHGLCRAKELKEAKKLLVRMVHSGPAPGSAVFNYVITAFSKGGEMEEAISLMKMMEGRGLRPDIYTYTVVMSGFAKGGLMDEAYEIYREAKKKHPKLSPVTYHILIRGYCKMEEYDKALNCLKEMKDDGLQPNSDEYNKLIQSLCLKALDWSTAEKLLEEMTDSGLFLNGQTRSLITAVKELEEEAQSESVGFAA
ncbi:pentatricopeptide repeat-containing protein [Canna indica]|uniref:Pentatricopeptide repeat-containing protein n=1 Tax=Canna indica TaxID=4628 RepID=A0AAQ3QSC1_9LILI|nr:pentatricopeptide repeat-containing protein [Canna indica]